MISSIYAIPVCLLLMVALIPTVLHNYIGLTEDDGRSVTNISSILNNFNSAQTKRNSGWGMYTFGSPDWIERDYKDAQNNTLKLFVARSFDYKRLYHHPELAISYGYNIDTKIYINLKGRKDIPVYILSNKVNSIIIAYALMHDNNFLSNPIRHQIVNSIASIFSPAKPMTLFYVSQTNIPSNFTFEGSSLESLLTAAITNFQAQGHE